MESHTIIEVGMDDAQAIDRCFDAFVMLRPHLSREAFVRQVLLQAREGYRIAAIEDQGQVVAAAGFRISHFLAWGKVLYLDDLVTCALQRGRGYGGALLAWLSAQGRKDGCAAVHLDSGYARYDAHRLYLNTGFTLTCHHLAQSLE